jgi:4,4'-diaponeurosporenoate glycosyltransferase
VSPLQLVLVGLGLAGGTWLLATIPRVRPLGRATGPDAAGPAARVSVVVPARDEAATLPRLLGSLRALAPAPHEVIVVDDGSTDGTADVAQAHGATVLVAPEPPDGWVGKPWACRVGAAAATGDHLLFLDADTWLAPDALPRLLAEHAEHGGLLSVAPSHETQRPYEQLSVTFNLAGVMGPGLWSPWRTRPSRRATASAAFGPCLLTTVADHRAAGGHDAVRSAVIEDVALARAYRATGLPVRCIAGGDAVGFRMYPAGVRQLVEGWSKNIAGGVGDVGAGAPLALLATVAWVLACTSVGAEGLGDTVRWATGGSAPAVPAAMWALVTAQWWWMLRRLGRFQPWAAVAFVVPLAAFLAVFARSAVQTYARRQVTWRGRAIPLGRQVGRPVGGGR